jgi:hypothetical protein
MLAHRRIRKPFKGGLLTLFNDIKSFLIETESHETIQRGRLGGPLDTHYNCIGIFFLLITKLRFNDFNTIMLTEHDAVAIYRMKISLQQRIGMDPSSRNQLVSLWGQSGPVAKLFGVSSRTVKYIWNRQTWAHATNHLWGDESAVLSMLKSNEMTSPTTKSRASSSRVSQRRVFQWCL